MTTRFKWLTLIFLFIAVAGITAWFALQGLIAKDQQLSVKPPLQFSKVKLEPLESSIGLQARLPFLSIISAAEHASRDNQTGRGEKQTCKKVLGAKVCATLLWEYSIARDGDVEVTSQGDRLQLKLPVSFSGVVSVDGRGGKLLGLRNKDIDGKLALIADLNVNIAANWCPTIESTVRYEWISDPKIRLIGGIRLNLRKSVDKALKRKVSELQTKLSGLVDCDNFRQTISEQWRVHTLSVAMKQKEDSKLRITPISASVSKIGIESDHIGIAFELAATVALLQTTLPTAQGKRRLPDLTPYTQTPGTVEFSLLWEVPYQQLKDTLSPKLIGKSYSSGDSNALTITSVDLYPSGQLLTIDVGFEATALKRLFTTKGHIYITARPLADPQNNTLRLTDLAFTRAIDSSLVSALTTIMRQQLLTALVDASTIELGPALGKIEQSVEDALSNPAKTGGIPITVKPPVVRLMALNPQSQGIAAIVHLSTQLDATIPEDVLIR